jgi:hypothetical protein
MNFRFLMALIVVLCNYAADAGQFCLKYKSLLSDRLYLSSLVPVKVESHGVLENLEFGEGVEGSWTRMLHPNGECNGVVSFDNNMKNKEVLVVKDSTNTTEFCKIKINEHGLPFVVDLKSGGDLYFGIFSNFRSGFYLVIGYDEASVITYMKGLQPKGMPPNWIQCK